MTAALRFLSDRAAIAPVQHEDSERWARIAMVAAAIPADADLSDEADVCRALMANRLCVADFDDILDDALDRAAENRLIRR